MLQGSLNKADSSNAVSGLYSFNSRGSSWVHSLVSFFYSGVGAAAIPARLRLRENFGERAFSPGAVLVSISFYIFICSQPIAYLFDGDIFGDIFTMILMGLFLILPFNHFSKFIWATCKIAYSHFQKVYSYSEENKKKYSYYRGDPIFEMFNDKIGTKILGYEVDEKIIRMYFEPKEFAMSYLKKALTSLAVLIPAIIFLGGTLAINYTVTNVLAVIAVILMLWLFTYSFTNFCLAFSGFCLMLEEISIAKKIRDTVLDTIDGEYDMEFLIKQKAALETSGNVGLEIAEDIFQNPNYQISMASLPTPFTNSIEGKESVKPIPDANNSVREDFKNTELFKTKTENKTGSELKEQKLEPAPIGEASKETSTSKSKTSSLGEQIGVWLFLFGIVSLVVSYLYYGLLPFSNYVLNHEATISPSNSKVVLKSVEEGLRSTTVELEFQNMGEDTLKFPYIKSGDSRSLKIVSRTIQGILLHNPEKVETIFLKDDQEFEGGIVVPPKENQTYKFVFKDFSFNCSKKFSIVSEDAILGETFLLVNDVSL